LLRGTIGAIHPNRAPLGSFEIAAEPPSRFIQSELRSYPDRDGGRAYQEARAVGFDGSRTIYQPHVPEYQLMRPQLVPVTPDEEQAIRRAAAHVLGLLLAPLEATSAQPLAELDGVKYSDYRMVDGVRVPFRIETGQEVWTVQQAEINIALPDKLFRR